MLSFKTSLRLKLIAILICSITIGLAVVGTALYLRLSTMLYQGLEEVLQRYALAAEQSLDAAALRAEDTAYLKEYADRTSHSVGCRVTLIAPDGRVLADSEIDNDSLPHVENHFLRPEIQQSLREPFGFDVRNSATINRDLVYLSIMVGGEEDPAGFVRLALFAEQAEEFIATARLYFISGGFLILAISGLLVILLTRKMNRNLNEVITKAAHIAGGQLDTRIQVTSKDELKILGASLNEMAAHLSRNLRKLARERKELDTVLSSVSDGIIAIGADNKVIFYNGIAMTMLQGPSQGAARKHYGEMIQNPHLKSLLEVFFQKPLLVSDEIVMERGNILNVVISPFQVEERGRPGAVIVLRDVTQYKKLEKIRRDFVANVSHEFKTPLAAIRGYAETLVDWGLSEPEISRKYVQKIIKQSLHLESLVSDLLQLARIERLQSIELSDFLPNPLIREVVDDYASLARLKGLEMRTDLTAEDIKIQGDPEMFRSIFSNLIDNAIKYTPEKGLIQVFGESKNGSLIFSVKDNGMGIPRKDRERIFERFYRVDKARSRVIGGTGLGLSIVKHLVELQQAEVWVESVDNEGSCFCVKFRKALQD